MGNCCCGKKHLTKRKAFHQELGAPLLESLAPKLGKNARVVVLRLLSLKHIAGMTMYGTVSNPFVQLRLMPEDEIGGPQHQSSTIIPGTVNPQWEPPERFQFVISDPRKARILISVFHYDESRPKENFPIGDSVIKLETLGLTSEPMQMHFKLVNPNDGQPQGEVTLMLWELTTKEAQMEIHETVYEYQEWSVLSDWQPMSTPGRWSSADGKIFKDDLESLALPVPDGWEVENTWNIMSTTFDPDGWQYTTQLDSAFWYPQNDSALYVLRRRTWNRDLRKVGKTGVFGRLSGSRKSPTTSGKSAELPKNSGHKSAKK